MCRMNDGISKGRGRPWGLAAAAVIAVAACGGDDGSSLDAEAFCRVGQRLVNAVADGDDDAVERRLSSLEELDGAAEAVDVDSVEDAAEDGDTEGVAELFDDADCSMEIPEVTEPPITPPSTIPTTTTTTEPADDTTTTIESPSTTAVSPGTTGAAPASTTPGAGGNLVAVDLGAGPVPSDTAIFGEYPSTEAALQAFAADRLPMLVVSGATVIGIDVSASFYDFSPEETYVYDTVNYVFTSALTLEDIAARLEAAVGGIGSFDYTRSNSEDEQTRTVGLQADSDDFSIDVDTSTNADTPGQYFVQVLHYGDAPVVFDPAATPAPLADALAQWNPWATQAGAVIDNYSITRQVSEFSGDLFVGYGISGNVAAAPADVAAQIAGVTGLTAEELGSDSWSLSDADYIFSWSIVEAAEDGESSVSFNYYPDP